MTQYLANLGKRGTDLQHAYRQGMPELMGTTMGCVDVGAFERVAHNGADRIGTCHQSTDRRQRAQKQVPVRTGGSPTFEIHSDRLAYIGRYRQESLAPALTPHSQVPCVPVEIIER